MWMKLRILFTVLAAVCVAAIIPLGSFLGWTWAGIGVFSAFIFYVLMLFCKNKLPQDEQQQNETEYDEPQETSEEK